MALKGQQQLIKGPNKRLRKRKLLYIVHTYITTAKFSLFVTVKLKQHLFQHYNSYLRHAKFCIASAYISIVKYLSKSAALAEIIAPNKLSSTLTSLYCHDEQNRVTKKSRTKSWIFKLNLTSLSVSQEKEQQSTDMQKRNNKKSSAEKAKSAFGLYHLLLQL